MWNMICHCCYFIDILFIQTFTLNVIEFLSLQNGTFITTFLENGNGQYNTLLLEPKGKHKLQSILISIWIHTNFVLEVVLNHKSKVVN